MKIVRQMGYTHADFFRLLPGAMGDYRYEVDGLRVLAQVGEGTLTITLGPEGQRRLVLVVIPQTTIMFEYQGVSDVDREAFVKFFDLRFMKGLG